MSAVTISPPQLVFSHRSGPAELLALLGEPRNAAERSIVHMARYEATKHGATLRRADEARASSSGYALLLDEQAEGNRLAVAAYVYAVLAFRSPEGQP